MPRPWQQYEVAASVEAGVRLPDFVQNLLKTNINCSRTLYFLGLHAGDLEWRGDFCDSAQICLEDVAQGRKKHLQCNSTSVRYVFTRLANPMNPQVSLLDVSGSINTEAILLTSFSSCSFQSENYLLYVKAPTCFYHLFYVISIKSELAIECHDGRRIIWSPAAWPVRLHFAF